MQKSSPIEFPDFPTVFAIEGLDRLGKSTLIQGILDTVGFYQVVHFGKPPILKSLAHYPDPKKQYQMRAFAESMKMVKSGANLIFDRWHLGECVYGPIYRGYDADYIFRQEEFYQLWMVPIRLILLVEDFSKSKHFVSDGDSFDDSKRRDEQSLFLTAFEKSLIEDKRIICVTDEDGQFRKPEDILEEALRFE